MEELLQIGYGLIEGVDNIFAFLTTTYQIKVVGVTLFSISPIWIISVSGLIFIFGYYLIRSMAI